MARLLEGVTGCFVEGVKVGGAHLGMVDDGG